MNIKNIIVLTLFPLSLYGMEIEKNLSKSLLKKSYGSLTETTLGNIHEQEYELCRPKKVLSYPDIMSLSLENMHKQLCMISDKCKRAAIRTVSTRLLQLVCAAICLPKDVVKNHICLFMLDGEKKAAKQLYKTPLREHFALYFDIKTRLADDTKPIGPLYATSEKKRDTILRLKQSWYYSVPIVSDETKNLLYDMDNELKQVYLKGQEVFILPDDEHNSCAPKTLGRNIVLGTGAGLVSNGIMNLIGALIGLGCCGNPSVVLCNPGFLGASISSSTIFLLVFTCCGYGDSEPCGLCKYTQCVTL